MCGGGKGSIYFDIGRLLCPLLSPVIFVVGLTMRGISFHLRVSKWKLMPRIVNPTLTKSPAINFTRAFPRVIPSPGLSSGKTSQERLGSSRELRRICLHRSPPSRSPIRERPVRTISRLKPQVGFGLSAVARKKLYGKSSNIAHNLWQICLDTP